jgi:flavin reductase (DIM6/NTAB) family NADH-FMN oxidoreductase RutF
MTVSKDVFRGAMGSFASGVTVVTTKGDDDVLRGMTVSAFSSLSLDPPLCLICIDRVASLHDHLREGSHFAVNVLAEGQEAVSRRFASTEWRDRFQGISTREGVTGIPLITGAVATIECRVVSAYPGGDHTIFVGEVVSAVASEGGPLLYYRGRYANLHRD